jgi:hypothetical protein
MNGREANPEVSMLCVYLWSKEEMGQECLIRTDHLLSFDMTWTS